MIKEIKLMPTTEISYPFGTANFHCNLSTLGYVEDEYFMNGTANIYEEIENHKANVIYKDAPYTTRFLVRRPIDIKKFVAML